MCRALLRSKVAREGSHPSETAQIAIDESRSVLESQTRDFELAHARIMGPILAKIVLTHVDDSWPLLSDAQEGIIENTKLMLPSSYPLSIIHDSSFKLFVDTELHARKGKAYDIIRHLKLKISMKSVLWERATKEIHSQGIKTMRARALDTALLLIRSLRDSYNRHRENMLKLGLDKNNSNFQLITPNDCAMRHLYHALDVPGMSKKPNLAWFWREGAYCASDATSASARWDEERMYTTSLIDKT
jgi:hypothetical protein